MLYLNDDITHFDFEATLPLLSDQRREQALKFKHELGRKTCAAAYLLLCEALRKEYGITDRHIIGVLTAVVRDGKELSVSDPKYRAYVHLWCDLFPIRAFILRLRSVPGRIKRKYGKK